MMKAFILTCLSLWLLLGCAKQLENSEITYGDNSSTSLLSEDQQALTSTPSTSLDENTDDAEKQNYLDTSALQQHPFTLSPVVSLDQPISLVVAPDSGVTLIGERDGRVSELHFADDGTAVKGEIVLDLSSEISTLGEGGLLGLAVSNDDKELYLSYTDREMTSQVISMALNSGLPNSDERRTILSLEQPFSNHNGGHLAVDQNGMLFVGFGDGGGSDDPLNYGQDRSNWFGSILRVDPSVESPYGVPEVNPFFGSSEIKEEILVWGLRNPWRYSIDKDTGDLWIGDVGQDHMEEVTWIPYEDLNEGNNLGWPNFEGSRQNRTESLDDHRLPNITYDHSDGRCSVTGGIVYNGADAPEFAGVYIFSDWCDGRIRLASISQDGDVLTYVTDLVVPQVIGFSEGRNGEIYVFSMQGDVFELNAK